MNNQHPKGSGALFANSDKKSQNHPDWRGNIEVTPEQMQRLYEMSQAGLTPKLQVAGWWRQPKSGGDTFLSMSTEAYMKQDAPQPPQGQNYQQMGQPPQAPQQPQVQPPQPNAGYAPQAPAQPAFPDEEMPF